MKKILSVILALYLILLLFKINSIPLFVGDEHVYSKSVQSIMSGFIDNNNHPLLAKNITALIVSLSYLLTGIDLPIYWRIGAILASLGSLIFLYKICRLQFNQKLAILAIILLSSDPLFFSYSRILNLDIVALFFSLASLYCLLLFSKKGSLKNIFWSAVLMGMSLSAKFNLIFILPMVPIIYYFLSFKRIGLLKLSGISYLLIFCGFMVGNISYFIFPSQVNFFKYLASIVHSHLTMSFAASGYQTSPAWSWFTIPQILTFYRMFSQNQVSTIAGLQNPLLFVLTIPTVCITIYLLITKKIRKPRFALIILVYLLGQYLPWLTNIRPTYYCYIIPLLPLIILLVIQLISLIPKRFLNKAVTITAIISLTLFLLYYPILIGLKIPTNYENNLFSYNQYRYPEASKLFCQFCPPR